MGNKSRVTVGIDQKLPLIQLLPLGFQHLFAMFGATILVPILTGLSPSVALFTSGVGTLLFLLITKGKVPAYLGSSFAFIVPLITVSSQWGLSYAMGSIVVVGLIYALIALLVYGIGSNWIDRVLPPVVIGSVIIVIGLGLAGTAVEMADLKPGELGTVSLLDPNVRVSLFTLAITVIGTVFFKGFFAVIPILIGIIAGYLFAITQGIVDFTLVKEASWFAVPEFMAPKFAWGAIISMAPVALVTIAEHLGDVAVISRVVGKDFFKEPGLHRTLLGDGLATSLAGLVGGPPNTTYGENVGVLAISQVYSVWVIITAAVLAICLSIFGKFGALVSTLPEPVMGGISMVLFGIIASSGLRTLVESGIDFSAKRNLVISSVILVLGIGGSQLNLGSIELSSMALATLVGIILNLVIPQDPAEAQQES